MAYDDEIPAYRPKSRARPVRGGQDSSFRNAVLSKLRGMNSAIVGSAGRARVAVRPAGAMSRRVIVKVRYVQGDLATSSRLHLAYVEREGVERDGTPGRLYTRSDPDQSQDPDVIREEMQRPIEGEKHQFRMIIAPEDGAELDLTVYMRDYMRRVERDMKQRLIWAAVNHFDTDQPHAHLIVRGVDRDGAEVRFQRAYIQRGLRHRAQELATEELGPRTRLDHERQLAKEVHQGRLTSIDRRIGKRAVDGVVSAADLGVYERERMRVLETMRLAEPQGRGRWRMAEGWDAQLKADGERGDIIKQMHRALPLDPARYQVIDRFGPMPTLTTEAQGTVHGRIKDKGLSDRAPDGMYVVVETARGNGYFVPLWRSEHKDVRIGDLVSLSQLDDSWVRPLDKHIAALARGGQGDIDAAQLVGALEQRLFALQQAGIGSGNADKGWELPANFLASVEARGSELAGGDTARALDALLELQERSATGGFAHAALLDGLRKRFDELAELGLVQKAGGDADHAACWRVADSLVEKLEARDVSDPKQHVSMRREALRLEAQLEYNGPTWLDRVQPLGQTGLPAELGEAKSQRDAYLKSLGVTDMKGLRALERDAVTKVVAGELGLQASGKISGFVGKVERLHRCPNGNHYAVVVGDGKLVAVATGRRTARLIGREVQLDFVKSEYTKRTKLAITPVSELQSQRRQRRDKGR
jgi:type IV secretory pathway VirD2 relaxase